MEWSICKNFAINNLLNTKKFLFKSYRETKQLIHRDLAARNVLIGENNVAKVFFKYL